MLTCAADTFTGFFWPGRRTPGGQAERMTGRIEQHPEHRRSRLYCGLRRARRDGHSFLGVQVGHLEVEMTLLRHPRIRPSGRPVVQISLESEAEQVHRNSTNVSVDDGDRATADPLVELGQRERRRAVQLGPQNGATASLTARSGAGSAGPGSCRRTDRSGTSTSRRPGADRTTQQRNPPGHREPIRCR